MKSTTGLYRRWKTKSVTRKALFISLVFHLFFLSATFYVVVQNQPIMSDKSSLTAELISVEHAARSKPLRKKLAPRVRASVHDLTDVRASESSPSLASPVAVPSETPRPALGRSLQAEVQKETPSPSLDLSTKNWGDVSTAARTLQEVEGNLSKTEAASPAGDTTFGAKRSGPPRAQRTPKIPTLKIAEAEEEAISPAVLEEIEEKRKVLPNIAFPILMKKLAQEIVETSEGGPIDVVFVIDASGSMGDNIKAVTEHLTEMVDVYKDSKIDYALGVTEFAADNNENKIKVIQLTRSFTDYRRTLQDISVRGDENALDAIVQTIKELRFRPTSKRHFILVNDEPLTSRDGITVENAIAYCREFGIYVNVLGLPLDAHQSLATQTGGKWHLIPEAPQPQQPMARRFNRTLTARNKAVSLRNAQWADVAKVGDAALGFGGSIPVDIVLFIDSSKSMEDKLPHFLQQLDILVRDWDNAFIDYQIGVVRFRSRASVNMVNVYNPPQTLKQIRKIVELPCQDDETLLDAVAEGMRRLKLRSNAQPYFILVTDEPAEGEYSPLAIIQMLEQKHVLVNVVGTYDDFQQQVATKTGGVWVPIPEGQTTNHSYW